jgi:hypothetical protein
VAEPGLDINRELEQILSQNLSREERIAWLETLLQREKEALAEQQNRQGGTPTQPLSLDQLACLMADAALPDNASPSSADSRQEPVVRTPPSLASLQERIRQETVSFEFDALIGGIGRANDPALAACSQITPHSTESHEGSVETDGEAHTAEMLPELASPDARTLRLTLPAPDNQNLQIQTIAGAILSVANEEKNTPDALLPDESPIKTEPNRLFIAHAELKHRLDRARRQDHIRAGIVAGVTGISLLTVIVLVPILTYRAWTESPSRHLPVPSSASNSSPIRVSPSESTPPEVVVPSSPRLGDGTDNISRPMPAAASRAPEAAASPVKSTARPLPRPRTLRPKSRIQSAFPTRRLGPVPSPPG